MVSSEIRHYTSTEKRYGNRNSSECVPDQISPGIDHYEDLIVNSYSEGLYENDPELESHESTHINGNDDGIYMVENHLYESL